jgi:hypothetical protein
LPLGKHFIGQTFNWTGWAGRIYPGELEFFDVKLSCYNTGLISPTEGGIYPDNLVNPV